MPVTVIDTIIPKNNGNYPITNAEYISVDTNGTRLNTALAGKRNIPSKATAISGTLADNTEYTLTDVSSLSLTFPETAFECYISLTTAASGSVTVTFPQTAEFIGSMPTFGNGEKWEISVKNGVCVCAKVGV